MSDYDRGPYTPPSERLAFEQREPARSGPAPVTLIVSGLILVAIVGGAVLLYRGGFKHRGDTPATVGAPITDMKSPVVDANAAAAAAPSQLVIDKTNAPAPPVAQAAAGAPPLAAVPGPPPSLLPAAAPAPAAPAVVAAAPATTSAPSAAPAPAATTIKPPKPLTIASLADDAVHHPTALRPALPVEPSPAPPAGHWAQIGAFSSAALADRGWNEIASFDSADMAGKGKQVQPTTHNGASFYRTIVTGFSSQASAEAFCAKLKAAGKPCIAK